MKNDIFQIANAELVALVKDSEKCAEKIISATENIVRIADGISDKNLAGMIKSEAARIFEATHFQDFTGQRVSKLKSYFEEINKETGAIEMKEKAFEKSLMEGPQITTASQDEIDKLFGI